jgi:hypothetical protein
MEAMARAKADEAKRSAAMRFNEGKPELHYLLFFSKAIEAFASVCTYGARKYSPWNFTKGGKPLSEYVAATLRHLTKWQGGEDIDPESGCAHLGHAIWNMLALAHFSATGNCVDDRPSKVLTPQSDV